MSRIDAGGTREIGVAAWLGARLAGRVTGTQPPAFVTVLGRGRRQFWGWLAFAGTLMPFGSLPRRETELVILRVSTLTDCAYENAHHRTLARRVGVAPDEVDAVCRPRSDTLTRDTAPFDERTTVVLDTTDALVLTGDLDDAQWARLRDHLDERECLELVQLVGAYVMLATTIRVLRIEPDRPTTAE